MKEEETANKVSIKPAWQDVCETCSFAADDCACMYDYTLPLDDEIKNAKKLEK